jgi:hypothetical protein
MLEYKAKTTPDQSKEVIKGKVIGTRDLGGWLVRTADAAWMLLCQQVMGQGQWKWISRDIKKSTLDKSGQVAVKDQRRGSHQTTSRLQAAI